LGQDVAHSGEMELLMAEFRLLIETAATQVCGLPSEI
jgi:hypothetical protein